MVDGIGPIPGSMFGPLGLEVSELKNSQLNWKTVSRGKRSRKSSVVRNSNGLSKLSSDNSPVRVVDFSGSDSEKVETTPTCPRSSSSEESLCVPLKKRRHILWAPNADQLSPQHQTPSDDFSGIALLAATACDNNTEEPDNDAKGGDVESPSSVLGRCNTLVSDSVSCSDRKDVLQIEDKKHGCLPEASSSANTIVDGNKDQSVTAEFVSSEADMLHQDLYTLMEACKENEASFNCIPKEKIHRDEMGIPKDSEHQMGILEVTGSEISERKNDIQMNEEEHFQKAFELRENGITSGEGMIRETSDTVVETSGTKSDSDKDLVSDTEVRTVCNLQESIKTHVYENEDHVQLDSTPNIYEVQMDYDSPYEDGELRGPLLYSCAENELEDGEHECVDYEDSDSAHYPGPEGSRATEESLGINKELDDSIENPETTERKNEPNPVDELASKHDGSGKRKCPFDIAVSRMEETELKKVISEKWQSCTEGGWHTSGRFGKVDISRNERGNRITRYGGGSSLQNYRQTEGDRRFYPDTRHDDHFRSRGNVHQPPRYHIGDSIGRFQENYQPEGIRQPFSRRRSPVKRFDSRGANTNTKVTNIRSNRWERSSEKCSGGYFGEEYDDDVEQRSAVYTRRVDRMRGPFQREEFVSSPRDQFLHTPPNSNRLVRETIFLKSPRDMFRQDQRLSDTRAYDRYELVDNCSHDTRTLSRRFPVAASNRDELDEHCNYGRQDERSRRVYGTRYSDERHFRFEEDYNRRGQQRRSFDGDYEESLLLLSPRSGWANEGNFVRSPSRRRYTRSPMGAAALGRNNERLCPPVGLSRQLRKSNDYSTQSRRDGGSFAH